MENKNVVIEDNSLMDQDSTSLEVKQRHISNKRAFIFSGIFITLIVIMVSIIFTIIKGKESITLNTSNNTQQNNKIDDSNLNKKTTYLPSSEGAISFLGISNKVDTFNDAYYLFGEVETDGNLFYVELLKDDKVINGYAIIVTNDSLVLNFGQSNSGFVTGGERTHKKFNFSINDLIQGDNKVSVKLYSDESKANLLAERSFIITKSNATYSSEISLNDNPQEVNPEEIFNLANINFEKDELWNYFHDQSLWFSPEINKDFLLGKSEGWIDYKMELVGDIGINNNKMPMYRFVYTYPGEGPGVYENAYYFYIVENKAYYITNSLASDWFVTPVFLFYMESSPYLFEDTIAELQRIPVDENNSMLPYTLTAAKAIYCGSAKVPADVFLNYQAYTVHEDLSVYDKYGFCRSFRLVPDYFKDEEFLGNSGWNEGINPDFNKMNISFNDGSNSDSFYSPYWYWCAGSRGYRVLDSDIYLESVGQTTTGDKVYIYKNNMPYPENPHLIPASSKEYPNNLVTKDNWQDFLDSQKDTYPILVIKNIFGGWTVYINADNFYVPGC